MSAENADTAYLVETVIEEARWDEIGILALADAAAREVLAEAGHGEEGFEISLLACNDARIAELNGAFRGKPRPTNVLSWPSGELDEAGQSGDEPVFLGDIALAYETCAAEAAAAGLTLEAHATHLVVHGVLHLLGHDHEEDGEAETMERIEVKILARLGIANPYT